MSNNRLSADELFRGMGHGMTILKMLVEGVQAKGGHDEIFSFFTRPRFKDNVDKICRAIVDCEWRIPASGMRQLAAKAALSDFVIDPEKEKDKLEYFANLCWYSPCTDLGIPYERYNRDPGSGEPAIPPLLLRKFTGVKMSYPLIIEEGRDEYLKRLVVVDWNTSADGDFRPGDIIDPQKIESLSLADAKYFDLEN